MTTETRSGKPTNETQASQARQALETYMMLTGLDEEFALRDLLCGLMHYADQAVCDFKGELDLAFMHYAAEAEGCAVILEYATIHKDKPISLEAVKVLGVPFTWGDCWEAHKLVPTPEGLVCRVRELHRQSTWVDNDPWSESDFDDIVKHNELYLVTFYDE